MCCGYGGWGGWSNPGKVDKVWSLKKKEEPDSCPMLEKPKVTISARFHEMVLFMMDNRKGSEWIGYIRGKVLSPNHYYLRDFYLPRQNVSAGSADIDKFYKIEKSVVGTIHSHHSMGTFFSGTDEKYVRANHDVTIVVADGDEMKVSVKTPAPCQVDIHQTPDVEVEPSASEDVPFRGGTNPYGLELKNISSGWASRWGRGWGKPDVWKTWRDWYKKNPGVSRKTYKRWVEDPERTYHCTNCALHGFIEEEYLRQYGGKASCPECHSVMNVEPCIQGYCGFHPGDGTKEEVVDLGKPEQEVTYIQGEDEV